MKREVFRLYGPAEDNLDAITKKITQDSDAEELQLKSQNNNGEATDLKTKKNRRQEMDWQTSLLVCAPIYVFIAILLHMCINGRRSLAKRRHQNPQLYARVYKPAADSPLTEENKSGALAFHKKFVNFLTRGLSTD